MPHFKIFEMSGILVRAT